jgi:hypothetical protein
MSSTAITDMPLAGYRLPDDFTQKANLGEVGDPVFIRAAEKFMGVVTEFLRQQKSKCEAAREKKDVQFDKRYKINNRRARLSLMQRTDETGRMDDLYEDGHVKSGVYLGWTCESVLMAAAMLYQQLLESYKRPCKISGRGNRAENETLIQVCEAIIDDMLDRADFGINARYITELIPRHGTVALRYEMGVNVEFARVDALDGSEVFQEGNVRLTPRIQIWPLDKVFVSHPNRPEPKDQEGIFWITPNTTIYDLEPDEVVLLQDSGRFVGKWRNLQQVRDGEANKTATSMGYGENGSFAPQYTLVEYEGCLPIAKWVRDGVVTYDLLRFFGVNVGPKPGQASPEQMTAWANRLSRIAVWNVAYLTSADGYSSVGTGGGNAEVLLRFQPASGRVPRRSLYKFVYTTDGLNFYGRSINDLGRQIEDAADTLFNSDLWTTHFNANPAKAFDMSGTSNMDEDEVMEALQTPNALVRIKPGAKPDDVLKFFQLPEIPNCQMKIQALRTQFESVTGITAPMKGMATAGTLGQDQINVSQGTTLFNKTILQCAQTLSSLMKQIISDAVYYLTLPATVPDRTQFLVDYITRISGLPSSEIEDAIPSVDGLENDIIVRHPTMSGADNSVITQFLIQLWTVTGGMGFSDPKAFAQKCLELQGMRDAEEITGEIAGMQPMDEERQMAQGNWIAPRPDEDFIAHLRQHQARMSQLAGVSMQGGQQNTEDAMLAKLLPMHISKTMELFQSAMQLQQMQQAMAGPQQPQQPGTPGQGGSQAGPAAAQQSTPQSGPQVAVDVAGKANPQPPSAPSSIPGAN